MALPGRRRLGSRIEAQLAEKSYSWQTFCQELPYTLWNTCPLCLCGLMPVFVVCISAMCRLDYATEVTDMGAKLINQMGLSYTVYYTAGCWPEDGVHRRAHCNQADFEIAAIEFDAVRGTLLLEKNVTKLHAKRLTAVKVTPDWRFVTFIGSLSEDVGNLYAVNAQDKDAPEAIPLLTQTQLTSLDAACELHTHAVREILEESKPEQQFLKQQARLSGFKHLQVIIPGIPAPGFGDPLQALPEPPEGSSRRYRAAFSFTCQQQMSMLEPIEFSKLAIVDFELKHITNRGGTRGGYAASQLRILGSEPLAPRGANRGAVTMAKRYLSQCCPRFVPSKQGAELLFVAEDVAPQSDGGRWAPVVSLPRRVLAEMQLLEVTGRKLEEEAWSDVPETNLSQSQLSQAMERHEAELLSQGAQEINANSQMLSMGDHEMPFAPVRGCPEFVPSFYSSTKSLQEEVSSDLFESEEQRLREQRLREQTRDSFVVMTDPSSSSVLGIDAQVLAGSLAAGPPMGEVSFRQLLYNVKSSDNGLVLGGCKPIRAAGREGHMSLESALESVEKTLHISDDRTKYTTWLACLTSDQKVAIVESEDTKNWINMSMPYPFWTDTNPFVWCAEEHQESCFEVWSNPNPNE